MALFLFPFLHNYMDLTPARCTRRPGSCRHPGARRSAPYAGPVDEADRHGSRFPPTRGSLTFLSTGAHGSEDQPDSAKRTLDQPNLVKGKIR